MNSGNGRMDLETETKTKTKTKPPDQVVKQKHKPPSSMQHTRESVCLQRWEL